MNRDRLRMWNRYSDRELLDWNWIYRRALSDPRLQPEHASLFQKDAAILAFLLDQRTQHEHHWHLQ